MSSNSNLDATGRVAPQSNQRLDRFQIGVSFRDLAEGRIHLEAGLQMHLRGVHIAEERVVTSHVVIIDRLFQQRDRTFEKKPFGFSGSSQFVQTKTGVQKSRAALRCDTAKLTAHDQGAGPFFLAHQMMETELKHFRPRLEDGFDGVQFRDRLAGHAEFGVTVGGPQLPFEVHGSSD